MSPINLLGILSLTAALAAPAVATEITVNHDGYSPVDGSASSDQQSASLSPSIEFESIGSFFVDFEEDGEAFVMIVQDDISDSLSPLDGSAVDEYRYTFSSNINELFAVVVEGSTAGLAEHADVEIENNDLIVSIFGGAEIIPGSRLIVSLDELAPLYHDGDINSGSEATGTD